LKIVDRIKSLFKKGGYALNEQGLKTINDHEKINIDPEELRRIDNSFDIYKGEYAQVNYVNSHGSPRKRDYQSINMMKLSSSLLSDLVFNEECEIVVSDANEEKGTDNNFKDANTFIQHVFQHNDFKKNLAKYLEPMFATGGIAARPYVDMSTGEVEFSWALANAFYPLRSNSNGISEGVMKSVTMQIIKGEEVFYTLLEFHEWADGDYVITNELYESITKGEVGKRVSLDVMYEGLEETVTIAGLSRPLFNYVTPDGFNNINPHSPLGLGIADNAKSTLRKINDTYDQFWWEIKMGQRTVFVSDQLLNNAPSENNMPPVQVFDPDTNVYKSMRMDGESALIKDVTSDIRTDQYTAAINQTLRTLEMEMKLSVGTFSFDGRSMKTATEIVSENDLTYRTRNGHVNEVEKFIKGLIISVLELAQTITLESGDKLFTGEIPTFEHIGVNFDDGVFQDRSALLKYYGQAKTFGFIPSVEAIKRIFKLPKETAEEWVKVIQKEQGAIDPMNITHKNSEELFGKEE